MVTGPDLRNARRRANLTLEWIAAQGGPSSSHLSRVESGDRTITPNVVALYESAIGQKIVCSEDSLPGNAFAEPGCETGPHNAVHRRSLVTALASAGVSDLLNALLPHKTSALVAAPALRQIHDGVAAAKSDYQACRYEQLLNRLPDLLQAVQAAEPPTTEGVDLARLQVLAADAFHVASSVLLKVGEKSTALVAADRSAWYAQASGDPVAVATSARIMTHALMRNDYQQRAYEFARRSADHLDRATRLRSPDAIAAHGALVLRGAVAAARADDRDASQDLLNEGSCSAAALGRDGNDRWTGFGPTNVMLHRVNVALALGDAGTAISYARQVEIDKVHLRERRAALFMDVAQAYAQWGRHEQALSALRTADRIAPEEVRTRPAGRRIIGDLVKLAAGPTRTQIVEFATSAGIAL